MKEQKFKYIHLVQILFRITMAVTLLSAVADRFGYWCANSVWGNWENFEAYTGQLLSFLPAGFTQPAAIAAAVLEIVLAILLLIGFKTRLTAILTGCLLTIFGLSMLISLGVKSTLDYSVWVGASGALLLAGIEEYRFSIDHYIKNRL